MNIIIGERYSGKTTELLKRSAKEQIYILVADKNRARELDDAARKLGLMIPFPVTVDEYFKGAKFRGSNIRREGMLIDDADDVLQLIFDGIEIKGITLTDHGKVKNLSEELWHRLTRNGVRRCDGVIFTRGTFKDCDGTNVPIIWNHNWSQKIGFALMKNRDDGVFARLIFDDSDIGNDGKKLLIKGDAEPVLYTNRIVRDGELIKSGKILGVNLVPAGAAYKYEEV